MNQVKKNKSYLQIMEEEHNRLPLLISQILTVIKLDEAQLQDSGGAKWRGAFRMMLMKFVLEALINKSPILKPEETAGLAGDASVEQLRASVDRIVHELLEYAGKAG